jgi:hypothetical protein
MDVCVVCVERTVAWYVKGDMKDQKNIKQYKNGSKGEKPRTGKKKKKKNPIGGMDVCVCCIRTVVWNVK